MPCYLNLSEPVLTRRRASEGAHRQRPRRATRVRAYASTRPPRSFRPLIPSPRRPLDTVPLDVLRAVLAGLHRLVVTC